MYITKGRETFLGLDTANKSEREKKKRLGKLVQLVLVLVPLFFGGMAWPRRSIVFSFFPSFEFLVVWVFFWWVAERVGVPAFAAL